MGKKSGKATVKCDWEGCDEYYASEAAMRRHQRDNHADATEKCDTCNEMFTHAKKALHCHETCKICGEEFTDRPSFVKHMNSYPAQGLKYSKALELILKGDADTIKKANKLAKKLLEKLNNGGGTKKAGVYLICFPWSKPPKKFKAFLEGQKYPGKDSTPHTGTSRKNGHNSGRETNAGVLRFYEECKKDGTRPIFFVAFDELSTTAQALIEGALIIAYGKHNLCNENNGSLPKGMKVDDAALFGAWLWKEAFQKFQQFDFSNQEYRIDISLEQSEKIKIAIALRKCNIIKLTKQEAIDKLSAKLERVKRMDDSSTFKQAIPGSEDIFVLIEEEEPKPSTSKQ